MSESVADIAERIGSIRQLGAVVNAMRGIASARARQARDQLLAVDAYEETIVAAIIGLLATMPSPPSSTGAAARTPPRIALVVFCAEQGFAGAFSERVFDSLPAPTDDERRDVASGVQRFVVGSRGIALAAARDIPIDWSSPMSSHSPGIARLADRIADALYRGIANDEPDRIDVVFTQWQPGEGAQVVRHRLLPLDTQALERAAAGDPPEGASRAEGSSRTREAMSRPMTNLPPERLLAGLTEDYVFARLCNAALHAFVAENEARMQAMAAAHRQIDRQLAELQARQRRVRQEAITAEIIELAAGETASKRQGTRRMIAPFGRSTAT